MATETKAKKEMAEAMTEAGESIDQVRDILFGAQMRTVDRRLAQLEGRFQRDLANTQKDISKQLGELDARLRKLGETLAEKLKAEKSQRSEDVKSLRADMNKGLKDLDGSLSRLDDATTRADAELRDQMLALGQSLSADIKALSERMTADVDRYVAELRSEKTDISSLVELYTDMARRLAEILEGPGSK